MKKKLLATLLFVLIGVCCAICLAACTSPNGGDKTQSGGGDEGNNTPITGIQLAAPQNLQIDETTLTWENVEHALQYVVRVDNEDSTTAQNSFSLKFITQEGTYKIKVKAIGDGKNYTDSEWSSTKEYIVQKSVDDLSIIRADGFTIDDKTLFTKVANNVTSFDFSDKIEVSAGAAWFLANDPNGESIIVTKTISLQEEGDKVVYIIVMGDEDYITYEVTVHRRLMYSVVFNVTPKISITQTVEEDDYASPLNASDIPTRPGYEHTGYDYDFSTPVTKDTSISLIWETEITYIDENGESHFISEDITILSASGDITLTGWYLLTNTVTGNFSITVDGEAHLILEDNCKWTVNEGGIIVTPGNTLYIYAQSMGSETGQLQTNANIGGANGDDGAKGDDGSSFGVSGSAGEAGTAGEDAGTIVINGGNITAQNIGGGNGGKGGRGGSGGISGNPSNSDNGGKGGKGGNGGAGGNGGYLVFNGGNITASNIGGGTGGSGGSGGAGGAAGYRGAGGTGGNGGAGGKGGKIGSIAINGGSISAFKIGGGNGGNGGVAGFGNNGGDATGYSNTGSKGGAGGNGGAGGAGGDADLITIDGGTVTVTFIGAGNGGNGGSSNSAGSGSRGSDGSGMNNNGYHTAKGGNGGNGGAGGVGGSGGSGGSGGNIGEIRINNGNIVVTNISAGSGGKGGNGGLGGNGGDGGKGGQGGRIGLNGGNGGNGGQGGKGGNGGQGGKGGNGGKIYIANGIIPSSKISNSVGGAGGTAGLGGNRTLISAQAGYGGAPYSRTQGTRGTTGKDGAAGAAGTDGAAGAEGTAPEIISE